MGSGYSIRDLPRCSFPVGPKTSWQHFLEARLWPTSELAGKGTEPHAGLHGFRMEGI